MDGFAYVPWTTYNTPRVSAVDAHLPYAEGVIRAASSNEQNAFPIRLENGEFLAEGKTYHGPTVGVAQVVEDPDHFARLIILFAGLGGEAMSSLADLGAYDAEASYVIFDGDEELIRGDWPADENLVWTLQEDEHRRTEP